MEDFENKVRQIKEKVGRTSIYIGRIPESTKTEFLALAKEEFEEDFGFTLKWLMDFRKGLLSSPNQILDAKIEILVEEINKIKEQINITREENVNRIKTLSGRFIGKGEKDVKA